MRIGSLGIKKGRILRIDDLMVKSENEGPCCTKMRMRGLSRKQIRIDLPVIKKWDLMACQKKGIDCKTINNWLLLARQ